MIEGREASAGHLRDLTRQLRDRFLYSRACGRLVLYPIAAAGYRRYRRSGTTPTIAYVAMRKLFGCRDPELFGRLRGLAAGERRQVDLPEPVEGVAAGEVEEVVTALHRDGYAVLQTRLDDGACDQLEACARDAVCSLVLPGAPVQRERFEERDPKAIRYDLEEIDILRCEAAQRLIVDASLMDVAGKYVGATPMQDLVAMWWSTPVGPAASSAAAQEFHFDLDRLQFLKIFVYVTDVDDRTGPHVYVRGTHEGLPAEFRRDGRYAENEVRDRFGEDVKSIVGPRGTVFLADTRGLHKGQNLLEGHRLVFQLEFSTSLFGQHYGRPVISDAVPELSEMQRRHPDSFSRFEISNRRPAAQG